MFNPKQLKNDFPIFDHHPDLVYLDNAATTQKPQSVIEAVSNYYQTANANVGRGVYDLAEASTQALVDSKKIIADFFNADAEELILTANATEAINGMAYGWADHQLNQDDYILISLFEHHSNLVVWQEVMRRTGAKIIYAKVTEQGGLDWDDFAKKIKDFQPKLAALTHVSNVTGAYLDLKRVVKLVKKNSPQTRVLIDGTQSASHLPINFSKLKIDFFAFSGHKMLGPMGTGGLLVRKKLLENQELQPWYFGGGMVDQVMLLKSNYHQNPDKRFQAGTPNVAGAVGLAAACEYLQQLNLQQVLKHDQRLVRYALMRLAKMNRLVKLIGPVNWVTNKEALIRVGSIAFIPQFASSHDTAQVLNQEGAAVRSGFHCAMPLHKHFNWPPTLRVSFSVYNDQEDVDQLITALKTAQKKLA